MGEPFVGDEYANTTGIYRVVAVTARRVRLKRVRQHGGNMPYWVLRRTFATWLRLDGGRRIDATT